MSNTILLIHGAWLNSRSWDAVKARYEAKGFTVVAPDWPYDDRSPEELRTEPDEKLAGLGVADILDHYDRIIGQCPEEPILIGHSSPGQTRWGTGLEQEFLGWLMLGLNPLFVSIEQAIRKQLLGDPGAKVSLK